MGRFVEIPDGLVIFWSDTVSTPGTGWTEVTGVEKYLRVSTGTIGVTGGSAAHTHTFSGTTGNATKSASYGTRIYGSDGWDYGGIPHYVPEHTHSISGTSASGTLKVRFTTLRMFKRVKGAGAAIYTFPTNALVLWGSTTAPQGWTKIESNNGYYIVQGTSSLLTNVAGTHTHTISGNSSAASGTKPNAVLSGSGTNFPTEAHVHALSGTSAVNSELEADYVGLALVRATTTRSANATKIYVPGLETTATGWTNETSTYNGKHLKINNSGVTTGSGNLAHTHTISPSLAAGSTIARLNGTHDFMTFARHDHSHSITVTSSSTTPSIEYYNVKLFSKAFEEIQFGDVAKLRYRRGGETLNIVSLSNPVSTPHLTAWHSDAYIYIPLVAPDSEYASYRRVRIDGTIWALEAL